MPPVRRDRLEAMCSSQVSTPMKGKCDYNPHKDSGDTLPWRSLFGAREGLSHGQRETRRGGSQGLLCMKPQQGPERAGQKNCPGSHDRYILGCSCANQEHLCGHYSAQESTKLSLWLVLRTVFVAGFRFSASCESLWG